MSSRDDLYIDRAYPSFAADELVLDVDFGFAGAASVAAAVAVSSVDAAVAAELYVYGKRKLNYY